MIHSFSTSELRLSPELNSFFSRHSKIFSDNPNLWVKGGAAKDALLNLFTKEREGYIREPESPRDWDLVLIRGDWNSHEAEEEERYLISEFRGEVEEEDFEIDRSLQYYFGSRDIGLNQVLINPKEMLATDIAVRDAKRGHVSPTPYEYRREGEFGMDDGGVGPKVALRSLLIGIRDGLKIRPSVLKSIGSASPFWLLVFLFKAGDIGLGDKFFDEIKKHHSAFGGTESFEEALLKIYEMVGDFVPTPKQLIMIRDAESILSSDDSPSGEKRFRRPDWIEARLLSLDSALKKIAQVSDEDSKYMKAVSLLAKKIIDTIAPEIERLDTHWSRSSKRTDPIELGERLETLGFNINKSTDGNVTVKYIGGSEDSPPTDLGIKFNFAMFSPEVQEILTNKKGLKRDFYIELNLNDSSEAYGGGASIGLSVKDIVAGGTNHNVSRKFWDAFDVFREQIYHEVTHLDRSGSSPESGKAGTIRYLANTGEMMAHASQAALIYFKNYPDDEAITWEKILSMRFPRDSSKIKVLNYFNLSQQNKIQEYQSLVPEINLSEISSKFLDIANEFYKKIKETH